MSLIVLFLIWKLKDKLLIGLFSPELAASVGISMSKLNLYYLLIFGATILLGLRFLGAILVGALIIIPAATGRQLTHNLSFEIPGNFGFCWNRVYINRPASHLLLQSSPRASDNSRLRRAFRVELNEEKDLINDFTAPDSADSSPALRLLYYCIMNIMPTLAARQGFTLIELLIVIAIIAVLSVVVVLVLSPVELLRQARDSTRLSDMATINKAIGIYRVGVVGGSLGSPNTIAVSLPDSSPTCANLGLPAPPAGWSYACASQANYRKVDGTGWLPIDFTNISTRSPLNSLPVDPINTVSSGYYYTYVSGGSWALSSLLESDKYIRKTALNDGGYDPGRFEVGSDLSLIAKSEGLVGWWAFDEGSGNLTKDSSGNGNDGSLSGTSFTNGQIGGAVNNNNTGTMTNGTINPWGGNYTISAWVNPASTDGLDVLMAKGSYLTNGWRMGVRGTWALGFWTTQDGGTLDVVSSNNTLAPNTWQFITATKNGSTVTTYVNGQQIAQGTGSIITPGAGMNVGGECCGEPMPSLFDDVRVYSRVLSAAEVATIYNATK